MPDRGVAEQRWREGKTVCQVGGRCGSPRSWRHLLRGHVELYLILLWCSSLNAFRPFELNAFILYWLSRCRWKVPWDGNVTKSSVLSSYCFNCLCSVKRRNWHSQSIVTTFKWGNIRGDTAALVQIYRYFLIQLRRWRLFNPCWSETLNFWNKFLPNKTWLQNSSVRENLWLSPGLMPSILNIQRKCARCRTACPSCLLEEGLLVQVLLTLQGKSYSPVICLHSL